MIKKLTHHIQNIQMLIICMDPKLPVNGFEWVKNLSKFNEDIIKSYDENSDKKYFLEVDVEYPEN